MGRNKTYEDSANMDAQDALDKPKIKIYMYLPITMCGLTWCRHIDMDVDGVLVAIQQAIQAAVNVWNFSVSCISRTLRIHLLDTEPRQ